MNASPALRDWLSRIRSRRLGVIVLAALLGLSVLTQIFIELPSDSIVTRIPGLGACVGFGAGVIVVLTARILGWLLKRSEDYYEQPTEQRKGAAHND